MLLETNKGDFNAAAEWYCQHMSPGTPMAFFSKIVAERVLVLIENWIKNDMRGYPTTRIECRVHIQTNVRGTNLISDILSKTFEIFSRVVSSSNVMDDVDAVFVGRIHEAAEQTSLKILRLSWALDNPFVYSKEPIQDILRKRLMPTPLPQLENHLADLLETARAGDSTDVEIRVGEKTFKAHRHILKLKTPYFEGLMTLEKKNVFSLKDISSELFEILYTFIYTGEVVGSNTPEKLIAIHEHADLYLLRGFKEKVSYTLGRAIYDHVLDVNSSNFDHLVTLATLYDCKQLYYACSVFAETSAALIDQLMGHITEENHAEFDKTAEKAMLREVSAALRRKSHELADQRNPKKFKPAEKV